MGVDDAKAAGARGDSKASLGGCGPLCRRICAFMCMWLGMLLLLLGVWCTHVYRRFTPVYRPIECKLEAPTVERVWFDHGFTGMHFQLITNTSCHNPNPYSVVLNSTRAANVYMGQERAPVGTIKDIPATSLPSAGAGWMAANITITPTADVLMSVFELLAAGQVPLYMESNMDVEVDIDFLFGRFSSSQSFSKDCGMGFRLVGMRSVVGPMACADTWEQLEIPEMGSDATGELALSAAAMGGVGDIERAARLKNITLGLGMGVGYGLGLALLACGCLGVRRICCDRKARAVAASGACHGAAEGSPCGGARGGAAGRTEEV